MAETSGSSNMDKVPEAKWYYADKGVRTGPFTREHMESLVREGAVTESASVWPGEGDWRPARETELAPLFVPTPDNPPPLPAQDIDNRFVWAAAAAILAGAMLESALGTSLTILYFLANSALCYFDEKRLKAAGHQAPESGWAWLVPVYLWKRANLLRQPKHYFWCWIVAFAVSIMAFDSTTDMEKIAVPMLNDYLEFFHKGSSCTGIEIERRLEDGTYIATTVTDDGKAVRFKIERPDEFHMKITDVDVR